MTRWDDYFMKAAQLAASMSKDSTQVGAALVGFERNLILTAFNGPPRGVRDDPSRFERPAKYLWASHAEANLIAFAARLGIRTDGHSVYVTHQPCSSCARSLIQAGIVEVVVGTGETHMPANEFRAAAIMFLEAGVTVRQLK